MQAQNNMSESVQGNFRLFTILIWYRYIIHDTLLHMYTVRLANSF